MLERLFEHDDLNYEVELPEDPSQWTEQINGILFTKYPELINFPAKLALDKFEPQKLYAKGSYILDINNSKLIIPVIVKSKKLQPLDIALINNKWVYLTPELLSDLINGSMSLGESMDNKDAVDFYSQSIQNDVPYGNFDRNTRTITASVINNKQKADLAKAIVSDKDIKIACAKNPAFNNAAVSILSQDAGRARKYKSAFVTRDGFLNGHIYVTDANDKREKISTSFSEAKNFVKKHMPESYVDFIKTGSACMLGDDFMADGHSLGGMGLGGMLGKLMKKITGPGMFSLLGDSGQKPVLVIKIKRVSKPSEGDSDLLGLGEKGSVFDVNDKEGMPCAVNSDEILNSCENLDADALKADTDVMPVSNNEYLEPVRVSKIIDLPIGKAIIGETKASQDTFVGLILNKYNKDKTASDCLSLLPKLAKPVILSPDTKFIKISSAENAGYYNSAKECLAAACNDYNMIKIFERDANTIAIKTAGENIICERLSMPYYLNSLGVPTQEIAKIAKDILNNKTAMAAVPKKRKIKLSEKAKAKIASINWLKVATYMPSEESVDSALALDYLDDETISEFYSKVPEYKNTLSELSKLLASVRLGNEIANEATVKNAIEALSDLINDLTLNRAGA